MRRTPPLIVGGGPAGAAAAITLAAAGTCARVLERNTAEHDPVCGGFLGWDALAALRALDIDAFELGARPIDGLRLIVGEHVAEAKLPHRAAGLSRRSLDRALLARAAARGAQIERGVTVRGVDGDSLRLGSGASVTFDGLILATGKHELRGLHRRARGRGRLGLRASIAAPAGLDGWIELHLLPGGYAGLLVQEDGAANLCLSVEQRMLAEAGGDADRLLDRLGAALPHFRDRVGQRLSAWSAIAAVPYGWRAMQTREGIYRVGDQAAVIASLAGDGIAIALASGRAAAESWLRHEQAPAYQRAFARRVRGSVATAELLRHGAERPWIARPAAALVAAAPALIGRAALLTRCPSPQGAHPGVVGL